MLPDGSNALWVECVEEFGRNRLWPTLLPQPPRPREPGFDQFSLGSANDMVDCRLRYTEFGGNVRLPLAVPAPAG